MMPFICLDPAPGSQEALFKSQAIHIAFHRSVVVEPVGGGGLPSPSELVDFVVSIGNQKYLLEVTRGGMMGGDYRALLEIFNRSLNWMYLSAGDADGQGAPASDAAPAPDELRLYVLWVEENISRERTILLHAGLVGFLRKELLAFMRDNGVSSTVRLESKHIQIIVLDTWNARMNWSHACVQNAS